MEPSATKTGQEGTDLRLRPCQLGITEMPKGMPSVPLSHEHTVIIVRRTVENARHQRQVELLELALNRRLQFWMDTCREVPDMQAASPQVLKLHRKHGCRFCVPAPWQVQYVVDALDWAMPGWEGDCPELFYTTLELSFPELVRACGVQHGG